MYDIEIFNNSASILNKKVPNRIISWITILILLLILFIFSLFISFNKYKTYFGRVKGGYVEVYNYDFPINKKDKLYIERNLYDYKIINIEKDKIILDIKLDNNLNIDNNILVINILKGRTKLINIIKNKWKDVFSNEKIK